MHLADKDFKAITRSIFKETRITMIKKLKEDLITMSHLFVNSEYQQKEGNCFKKKNQKTSGVQKYYNQSRTYYRGSHQF